MAAQIDAQHTHAARENRGNLLGPHAGIGGERVHETDGARAFADKVVVKPALAREIREHSDGNWFQAVPSFQLGSLKVKP